MPCAHSKPPRGKLLHPCGEELSITQSAVSRHIRTLEEHFACRLFVRSGRSLQLTEAARVLLPGVREGFAALERACETLRGEDDILRMKAPSTLTMRWLLARLSRFRHLQPGNEVQLTSAWMDVDHVDFNQEPFDCAVLLSDGVFPRTGRCASCSRAADPGRCAGPARRSALGRVPAGLHRVAAPHGGQA
jgi:DNA-binding transcriptional LysR family regulator